MKTKAPKSPIERLRGRLFIALNSRGLTAWRSDIVIDITGGKHTSTSDLNEGQLQSAINHVNAGQYDWVRDGEKHPAPSQNGDTEEARNAIRRRIISKFIEMGAVDDNGDTDMKFIYRVIIHFWHKRFNDMTVKELNAVAALLQNKWLPWYYKKLERHADFSIKMVNLDATKKTQTEDNGK